MGEAACRGPRERHSPGPQSGSQRPVQYLRLATKTSSFYDQRKLPDVSISSRRCATKHLACVITCSTDAFPVFVVRANCNTGANIGHIHRARCKSFPTNGLYCLMLQRNVLYSS